MCFCSFSVMRSCYLRVEVVNPYWSLLSYSSIPIKSMSVVKTTKRIMQLICIICILKYFSKVTYAVFSIYYEILLKNIDEVIYNSDLIILYWILYHWINDNVTDWIVLFNYPLWDYYSTQYFYPTIIFLYIQ